MSLSLHHAFMPHSLPDQKTQNEIVMNRNCPVLEYPETVNLKYLIRPREPLRVRDAHKYNGCLSPCVIIPPTQLLLPLEGILDLHKLSAVQKLVGCCPKQRVNSVPQKVELLTDNSRFSAIICQTSQLFTSSFCSLLQTPVKRNSNMGTKPRLSFLRHLPKNTHNKIKNPSIPTVWAHNSFANSTVDSNTVGAREEDMIWL